LSIAIEPAIEPASPAANLQSPVHTASRANTAARPTARPRRMPSPDEVLQHYLNRIDPAVAASFTEAQRQALKTMLGARGVTKHAVEIRHSIPFGKRQIYTVLLMGREQRSLLRGRGQGASRPYNFLVYACLAALISAPVLGVILARGL